MQIQAGIKEQYQQLKTAHADASRTVSKNTFKSGLADHGDTVVKYHTTTHLLHAALRKVLGESVEQKGSNITADRLRFDFSFNRALTAAEKQQVEELINTWIKADLLVDKQTLPKEAALKSGAIALFVERYPSIVNVYSIGSNPNGSKPGVDFISREFCSGPHVTRTGVIGEIVLDKEKAVADGVGRIYALQKSV
jgi:alanyl-tRNA synthetase